MSAPTLYRSSRGLWLSVLLLALALAAASCGDNGYPVARDFWGLPQVGALFAGPSIRGPHFCTVSVVDSPSRNLVVTAAHCISGDGRGLVFVPRYHDGKAPFGIWTVGSVYAGAPNWIVNQDPRADYAFLRVDAKDGAGRSVNVEDVVGGDRLVVTRRLPPQVTVVGYPAGRGGGPVICANRPGVQHGFLRFDCNGYVDGTSGGPWLALYSSTRGTGDLVGLIGGLQQGGCSTSVSYSPELDTGMVTVFERAVHGGPGDVLPVPKGSGC